TCRRNDENDLIVAASSATATRLAQGVFPGNTMDQVRWIGSVGADYGVIAVAEDSGINIFAGSPVKEIKQTEDNQLIVVYDDDGEDKYLIADKVLMAVGRQPDYGGLDVEGLGLELDENDRGIKVDAHLETSIPGIYAIGDVTDMVQLAHVASHQGVVAVKNIVGEECEMDYSAVPSAIFTDPEMATVGLDEESAREQGLDIEIGRFPFSANGKVLTHGETDGFIKLIKNKENDRVLGAAITGVHATDLIAELTLAVENDMTAEQLIETIHAHPTTAEVVHEAALATTEDGPLHYLK
ncbi:MAG: dihydrolipoyl dehydrogenase family protein, partial [Bacillota bacterium]